MIKAELDRQVEAKRMRKDNLAKENNLYDEMHDEHGKLLEQREKQKAEATKMKILEDKNSRDQ